MIALGPGSLPPGSYRRRHGPGGMHGEYDDGASDISSTSGFSAFGYRSGNIDNLRLFDMGSCFLFGNIYKYQSYSVLTLSLEFSFKVRVYTENQPQNQTGQLY